MRLRESIETVLHDVRYAWRALRRQPAFTAAAVLTLALGIGANSAMFSVVRAVLLCPLPYVAPERVVMVWNHWTGWPTTWLSQPEAYDYAARREAFAAVAPFSSTAVNLTGSAEPERVRMGLLSAPLLPTLGVRPLLGRNFTAAEDAPGGARVVLLGYGLWQRRYGGDPAIVGRQVEVDGVPSEVVGVLPQRFALPIEFTGEPSQIFQPLQLPPPDENQRGSHYLEAVARLRPGLDAKTAERRVNAWVEQFKRDHPDAYGPDFGVTLVPVAEQVTGPVRPVLLLLLGVVGFVLLIGCANVANLLLARAEARQREIAIRAALGAGGGRLLRQLLTESVVLALAGGGAGLAVAALGERALAALGPANLPRAGEVGIDGRVLAFTVATALLTGLVFGLAPAAHLLRRRAQPLREGRGTTAGGGGARLRQGLITVQVALAVVAVAGAALMARSYSALRSVPSGFHAEHVLTLRLSLPPASYRTSSATVDFFARLLAEVREQAGVRAAGATNALPLGTELGDWNFRIEGRPLPKRGEPGPVADWQIATPGYVEAMGMRVVRGRSFTTDDRQGRPPVILLSETTAKRYWPNADPVGSRVQLGGSGDSVWRTVVGVVGDVKHKGLDQETRAEIYLPHAQFPATAPDTAGGAARSMSLAIRTAADPRSALSAVRGAIARRDAALPVAQVRTLDEVVASSVSTPRIAASLLGAFAGLALLLAAVGVYGVMAYAVARRTNEIGIRVALGAVTGDVMRLVVRQGMRPAAAGLGLGVAGALAGARLVRSLLFGVSATDALSLATAVTVMAAVGLLATLLPARRATRVDPLEALRSE